MIIQSAISQESSSFRVNFENFSRQRLHLLELRRMATSASDSSPASLRHVERGRLLVRERIEQLIDPASPFLEIAPLAAADQYAGVPPGAGLVTGIGQVAGRQVMIVANDPTVKGGTYFPLTVKKHLRAQEIALENILPSIYLVDSGGAFLPLQDQVFPDRDHFGRIFYNQAKMSALGLSQIAVVLGSCTAGGAYLPAVCDEAIIVRNQGTIFLAGPPLVKAATGEEVSAEDLGGGYVHSVISGVTDHLADSEQEALATARRILATVPVAQRWQRSSTPRLPLYDPYEIYGLLPADVRKALPTREVLARLLDGSELDEFKALYGTTLICGFAHIDGYQVGVVANDGILFSESALKAAHFVQLCNQRGIPLVFVQNITGFMVGKEYEHGGIAKHGAKMVTAVACSAVPKYTLVIGGSYGAGNYGMAGRAYQPRMLYMWPNSRIAVMGPEQAASVLAQVKGGKSRQNSTPSKSQLKAEKAESDKVIEQYQAQSTAWHSTAMLWDDGVIDPTETRTVLSLSIGAGAHAAVGPRGDACSAKYGVFRM